MLRKAKQLAFVMGTFIISFVIVLYLFAQLMFQIPGVKEPLEGANITKKEIVLNVFGVRISEEKQLLFEQIEGEPFYSESATVDELIFYGFFILAPSVVVTSAVVAIVFSIQRRKERKFFKQKDTSLQNEYFQKYSIPEEYYKVSCSDTLNYNPSTVQP